MHVNTLYTLYLLDVYTETINNQQSTGDQHADFILGLTSFLSHSKQVTYVASNLHIFDKIKDNCIQIFRKCS